MAIQAELRFTRTFHLTEDDKDAVFLTIDETYKNKVFINIASHRTTCSCTIDLKERSALDWIMDTDIDYLIKHLFEPSNIFEFDPVKTTELIREKVKNQFNNNGLTQESYEEFWDEHSCELDSIETREDAVSWIVEHLDDMDSYDAYELASELRYTSHVRLISEDALPMIKRAIKHGLITEE